MKYGKHWNIEKNKKTKQILDCIENSATHYCVDSETNMLNNILDYIEENLVVNNKDDKDYLIVKEIAKNMNLSESSLQNLFNNGCPITIHEYIVKRRMSLASHNLIESDEKIINIAQKYGYNADSFRVTFKKIYGLTPKEYRERGILQKDFERFCIKIIDLDSLNIVQTHCLNCEFCMCGNDTLVCAGRDEEYGMPIDEMEKKYPNGCDCFGYSLNAYIENEKKKERLIEELIKNGK